MLPVKRIFCPSDLPYATFFGMLPLPLSLPQRTLILKPPRFRESPFSVFSPDSQLDWMLTPPHTNLAPSASPFLPSGVTCLGPKRSFPPASAPSLGNCVASNSAYDDVPSVSEVSFLNNSPPPLLFSFPPNDTGGCPAVVYVTFSTFIRWVAGDR